MTDRPILFSAPLVRALLDGRKTQTRRLAWRQAITKTGDWIVPTLWQSVKLGDRLWVRETWKPHSLYEAIKPRHVPKSKIFYCADDKYSPSNTSWRPSIHMPRWASRLTLVVTDTKRERVQEISEADARAEGGPPSHPSIDCVSRTFGYEDFPRSWFAQTWDFLHTKPGARWEDNPEVVALTFTVHQANIDALKDAA